MSTPDKIYTGPGPCNDNSGIWWDEIDPDLTHNIEYIRSDIVEQMVKDETERCAKIADDHAYLIGAHTPTSTAKAIAKAIRGE